MVASSRHGLKDSLVFKLHHDTDHLVHGKGLSLSTVWRNPQTILQKETIHAERVCFLALISDTVRLQICHRHNLAPLRVNNMCTHVLRSSAWSSQTDAVYVASKWEGLLACLLDTHRSKNINQTKERRANLDKAKIKANLSSCVRIPVEARRENILKQRMNNERLTSL